MTNILEELKEIMKDDNEHNVELNLDFTGLTVYLDLATEDNCTEMYMIPIKYDGRLYSYPIPRIRRKI